MKVWVSINGINKEVATFECPQNVIEAILEEIFSNERDQKRIAKVIGSLYKDGANETNEVSVVRG